MTSLDFVSSTTALVLIDLQNGIVSRTLAPHSATNVVERSVQLAHACRAKGGPIVAVHVTFSADGADRLRQPVDEAMAVPPGGFPAGWSELAPEIAALDPEVTITKRQWGAFHGTELDLQLRRRGVTTIVLCGIATNFGVEMTAREAWQHGYNVVIAEDACSSMDLELHRFAIGRILPRISRVRSTAEIVAALGTRR
jgi:nicotinamidase-related amidase